MAAPAGSNINLRDDLFFESQPLKDFSDFSYCSVKKVLFPGIPETQGIGGESQDGSPELFIDCYR